MSNRALFTAAAAAVAVTISAAAQAQPVITFNADWSVTQSAPLVAGQQAILRYNTNRLPECRATYNGLPAWAIIAWLQADSSSIVHNPLINNGSISANPVDVTFTVPYGADLSMWFENSDEWGCLRWDSNYSQNFHFAIQAPPTIHFNIDWSNPVVGTLQAGQSFAVDYDIRRASGCRASYNGYDAWGVQVFYRFDGGAVSSADVAAPVDMYHKGPAPAVITAPAGAHQVEMWFQSTDYTGCVSWDSRYGQNYQFSVQ